MANLTWFPCVFMSFSTKETSVALGNQHSSSSRARMPGGLFCRQCAVINHAKISIKTHRTESQNICTRQENVLGMSFEPAEFKQHCALIVSWPLTGLSMSSMQGCRSRPKSMKFHSIPSLWYSSCSRMNMVWLKSCCSFSLV